MLKSQRFKKIHIDNCSAGGDDHIDHVMFDHIDVNLHAASGAGASGDAQHDRTLIVLDHSIQDIRRVGRVSGRKGHLAHGPDNVGRVE